VGATEQATGTLVLVGGHESSFRASLPELPEYPAPVVTSAAGRPLHQVVSWLLTSTSGPVVVVPMTFGRDPRMVADVAKTLSWLSTHGEPRVALAPPFGTLDHLTAWLRRAATQVRAESPEAAVVLTADMANPFDDAELHRVAHLVRAFGAGNEIDVALVGDRGTTPTAERLGRLGFDDVVLVPAGLQRHAPATWMRDASARVSFYGPIVSEQALALVVRQRHDAALKDLRARRTGIAAGLAADHGHGYAHSHAFDEHHSSTHEHRGSTHEHHPATSIHAH
jgi:sirohydrochlorin cobaltochelatase